MTGMEAMTIGAADQDLALALLEIFRQHGYARSEPDILQPADIFLDVSGEDMRKRMFMTQDADGREWCLRPEYTIPVCRSHLAALGAAAGGESSFAYAYAGPVFRMRSGESGEFRQAGIELLGGADPEAADAEVMALTCEAVARAGLARPDMRLGDVAILKAVLASLALPAAAQRRLMRAVSAGQGAAALSALDAKPASSSHAGLVAALAGQDPRAAQDFVEDVLSIAGIDSVGGRSAADIAARFLARAGENGAGVADEARAVVARLLAVQGDPDSAAGALRALAGEANLALDAELDALEARTGFLAARGLDISAMRFEAGFARNLDYYTSFIFELHDPAPGSPKPVAGGGRYDTLLARLGASSPTPAVGASIWLDRLVRRPA
jgi:ATP phosphoribosyltransferase regulatory subunit